jgi:hypothetical protein
MAALGEHYKAVEILKEAKQRQLRQKDKSGGACSREKLQGAGEAA